MTSTKNKVPNTEDAPIAPTPVEKNHFVLGTAGHIDHGKTALVKALTGIDTDRLKEEKARGITIELGFAHLETEDTLIGFVDVPGHEKFIRAMASGAEGMDAVMLVVAADEGVMPQTREHLAICNLLSMTHGIIAVTKTDLVEPEWLEMVDEIIRESVESTFLENCPIIHCSSVTGLGIDDLRNSLTGIASGLKERPASGLARLPIDRVFTMKGFGTVVTGTLVSGTIRTGDEMVVQPSGVRVKIRGLQVHGKECDAGAASTRLAVNLKGAEKREFARGDVLVHPNTLQPTNKLDVMLTHLSWNNSPLKSRKPFTVLYGAGAAEGSAVPLEGKEIEPGRTAPAQIHLKKPLVVYPGDRFIIQGFGINPQHGTTTGGGLILRPHPRRIRKPDDKYAHWLGRISTAPLGERILLEGLEAGPKGVSPKSLSPIVPWTPDQIENTFSTLTNQGELVLFDEESNTAAHPAVLKELETRFLAELNTLAETSPLAGSYPKQELFSKMKARVSAKLFGLILERLENKRLVRLSGEYLSPAHDPFQEKRNLLRDSVAAHFKKAGLTPPKPSEAASELSVSEHDLRDLLAGLVREGVMLRGRDDIYFHADPVNKVKTQLVDFLKKNGEITPLQFKDMCGITRRFLIPLAEMFDEMQITIRTGEVRRLRKP